MKPQKSVIAAMALERYCSYCKQYVAFKTKFGWVEYAFTKDCPESIKNDVKETIEHVVKELGLPEATFFESRMDVVTRDQSMWDK